MLRLRRTKSMDFLLGRALKHQYFRACAPPSPQQTFIGALPSRQVLKRQGKRQEETEPISETARLGTIPSLA